MGRISATQPAGLRASLLCAVVIATACQTNNNQEPGAGPAPVAAPRCIVDTLGELRVTWQKRTECTPSNTVCRDACNAGDPASCMSRAIAIEKSEPSEARTLYERACELGLVSGCTNYASLVFASGAADPQFACAERVFDRSCTAKDPFACGMLGRMILDAAKTKEALTKGSEHLQRTCDALEGFPCRVLARHLEIGQLGTFDPAMIGTLLERACHGGDRAACGATTASQTFR